jgi:N-acetylglucosamine kinase-like BadF-type ATPase
MRLIADGGSTKTDWCITRHGRQATRISAVGINPVYLSEEEIKSVIESTVLPRLEETSFDSIHYYGAGCIPEKVSVMQRALGSIFSTGEITVESDMLGAARALSPHRPGIVCIMGTGSNSCFFDGEKIRESVPPLGYILGDEGSGAVLGKLLVGDMLKDRLGSDLKERFLRRFDLTAAGIIENVYRKPNPNRFLASLSVFIAENIDIPALRSIALASFVSFIERNIMRYDFHAHPVHFTGSIAANYRPILEEAARQTGIRIGHIVQSPMEGLIKFHSPDKEE